jgi:electron transport complex protein RnfA
MQMILIFLGAALVNNVILTRALGVCPFIGGASKQLESSLGMGLAVTFIMTLSAAVVFVIHNFILYPLGATYLNIIVFVLIIVSLVQLMDIFLKKAAPALHQLLGVHLPLVTTNCAVLGIILINVGQFSGSFALTLAHAVGAAVGFALVMVLFAGIRERIEYNQISADFKGIPIAMIAAGLMAIVFFGFTGLSAF